MHKSGSLASLQKTYQCIKVSGEMDFSSYILKAMSFRLIF